MMQDIANYVGLDKVPEVEMVRIHQKVGGYFDPKSNRVVINLSEIRTFRDLIYVMAHEFTHVRQCKEMGATRMLLKYAAVDYDNNPLEKEADDVAFAFEDSIMYKNRVINHNTSSIWLIHKMWREGF